MEELAQEHAAALQPMITNVRGEIGQLLGDVDEDRGKLDKAQADVAQLGERLAALAAETSSLVETRAACRGQLVKAEPLPEKARRQAEAAASLVRNVQGQLDSAVKIVLEYERQAQEAAQRERVLHEELARLMTVVDRSRVQVEAKERGADDVRRDVEAARMETDRILAEQAELDIKVRVGG